MATYYISPTGDDGTGDGSSGNPWLTLTTANSNSTVDDTIILLNGTYTWNSIGQMSEYRTYQGETIGSVTIDGGGAHVSTININKNGGATVGHTYVKSIRFTDISQTSNVTALQCATNSSSALSECNFANCQFDTMITDGPAFNDHFMVLSGGPHTFDNCLFYDISFATVPSQAFLFDGSVATVDITNSTIVLNSTVTSSLLCSSVGAWVGFTINNSIVANFQSNSVAAGTWDSADNTTFYNITSTPSGTNILTGDPLFVDEANGNFNLRPTSPCIGTGAAA